MEYYRSENKNRENILTWYRSRRSIFMLLCFESLLHGLELTVLEPTEYFYYKDILHAASPLLCYSLSLSLNVMSNLLSNIMTSYIIKRYNIATDTMLLLVFISTIGHCLYFVTAVPSVVVLSRFITGLGKATNVISTSYIEKLYSEQDLAVKKITLSNFVTIGTIIGPLLTFIFVNINFDIGTLNLNYGNSPGFYMSVLKFIFFAVTFLFLDDIPNQNDRRRFLYQPNGKLEGFLCRCKAEEDTNEYLIQNYDADVTFDQETEQQYQQQKRLPISLPRKKIALSQALGDIVFNNHASLIFAVILIHGITYKIMNSLIPVISSTYFSWNVQEITGLCFGNSLFGTITSIIMAYYFLNSTHYLNMIGGMVLGLFSLVLMSTARIYGNDTKPASVLFCFMSFFNVLSACLVGQSARMVLIHITDKSLRSFVDAIRTCLLEASFAVGALLIMAVSSELEASGIFAITAMLIIIAFIMFKLKHIWV